MVINMNILIASLVVIIFFLCLLIQQINGQYDGSFGGLNNCSMYDRCINYQNAINCACDEKCAIYADCCFDATSMSKIPLLRQDFTCVSISPIHGYFMIGHCPEEEDIDEELKIKCEKDDSFNDLMASLPVVNIKAKILYKNIFCALCHSERKNLLFWNPKVECNNLRTNLTESYVKDKLFYDSVEKQWKIPVIEGVKETNYSCNIIKIPPLDLKLSLRSCIPNMISECPDTWNDERTREACSDYQATVYKGLIPYRNQHCAICDNVQLSTLTCQISKNSIEHSRSSFISFSILFDINIINTRIRVKEKFCKDSSQIFDPFKNMCRNLLCLFENFILKDGSCVKLTEKIYDKPTKENFTKKVTEKQCPKVELNSNEYNIINETTIFVPLFDKYFHFDEYLFIEDKLFICANYLSRHKLGFPVSMEILTNIGLSISIAALILHLIAFSLVREFRNLSGQNSVSLSVSLIIAYLSFLVGQTKYVRNTQKICATLGLFMYYFFLSAFCWINVMAFDVWRTLRIATSQFRITRGKQIVRFALYSIYVWILSAIIASLAIFSDSFDIVSEEYKPMFGSNGLCWFGQKYALLVFFALPTGIIMLINMILFIWTGYMLSNSSRNSSFTEQEYRSQSSKINFKLYLKLFLLMGLTWIVGFMASFSSSDLLWYLFIFLNTFQGLFIFISFSCKSIVFSSIKSRITYSTNIRGSNSVVTSKATINNSKF